uniref:Kazal protease inhibitor n=1 Tax=Conus ermineus TaxID=55423 RepID=A0A346CIZ3_CONER|nr:kazal protease inhibitor [Conus ermineus]
MQTVLCVFLAALALVHGSAWTEQKCDRACTMEYEPHCVKFQKTVPNKCAGDIEICKMRAQGYTVTSSTNGTCTCSSICTMEYNPVCAMDLDTSTTTKFGNPCGLNLAVCKGKRMGEVPLNTCPELFE